MINEILKFLSDTFGGKESEFKSTNFKSFSDSNFKGNVFAVDGGSGIVLDGGSWIIAKIKIGETCYRNGKRVSEKVDEYLLSVVDSRNKRTVKIFPETKIKLTKSNIDELPNEARDLLEKRKIEELSGKISDEDIILTDGLFNGITGKNLVAVCKTSRLRTKTGRSLLGSINEMGKKEMSGKKWAYPLGGSEFIVKFHEKSRFCYKVSISNPEKMEWFLSAVSCYSKDPEIIGYPYPLLRIDKVARLREDEKKTTNQRIKMSARQIGMNLEDDEAATVMHSLLDERAYR